MIATSDQILAFWRAAGPAKWFEADDAFDGEIRARFMSTYEAAAGGALNEWQESRDGVLALLVLLDQSPAIWSAARLALMRPTGKPA